MILNYAKSPLTHKNDPPIVKTWLQACRPSTVTLAMQAIQILFVKVLSGVYSRQCQLYMVVLQVSRVWHQEIFHIGDISKITEKEASSIAVNFVSIIIVHRHSLPLHIISS